MSARQEMLERIRRAAAVRPVAATVVRDYRVAGVQPWQPGRLVDVFIDRLIDYKAGVHRCHEAAVAVTVTQILRSHGARNLVLPGGIPEPWMPEVDIVLDVPRLRAEQLDTVSGVLTTSAVAIAETGTIVLDGGPGMGRRAVTLVPDLHVVVAREADIVRGVPEALERLDPAAPLTWISGPSATSDIELNRIEGVHGPRHLEVVLIW